MLIEEPSHDGVSLVGKAGDCNSPERKLIACSSQAFITISDRVAVAVIEEKEVISYVGSFVSSVVSFRGWWRKLLWWRLRRRYQLYRLAPVVNCLAFARGSVGSLG